MVVAFKGCSSVVLLTGMPGVMQLSLVVPIVAPCISQSANAFRESIAKENQFN